MKIDLNSPVEVWRIDAPNTGFPSCELTLFNLSGQQVVSVEVTLTLLDPDGQEITRITHRAHGLTGAPMRTFSMTVPVEEPANVGGCEAIIEKVWYDNSSIWRRGKEPLTEYTPNNLHRSTALSELREVAGNMAAGYPEMQGDLWLCVCGRPNPVSVATCARCGRDKRDVFTHFSKEAVDAVIAAREKATDDQNRVAVEETSKLQAQREQEVTKRRRHRRVVAGAVALIVLILGGGYGIMFHLLPQMKYNDAQTALTNGEYTAAAEKFAEISSYKDAADMVEESNYRHAEALLDSDNVTAEDIAQARTLLDTLTDQTRTDDLRKSADYQEGLLLLNEGKLDDAEKLFTALGDYENSRTQLQEIAYRRLSAEMETASDYDAIREGLTALNGYQDSAALIEKTWYLEAKSLLEGDNPDPVSAIACLEEIPDYEGAAELARQAHYAYGKQLQAAGETATAAEQFYLAKGYEDADEQANVSYYAPAVKALEAGKFKEAARLLQNIRDYSDADDLWKQAIYQQALVEMKALDFDAATALLNQLPADYNDVATLLKDCVYQPAQIAYSRGEYEAAIAGFTAVSDYSEAADMIRLCNYDWAAKKAQDGDYDGAIALYEALGDYKDSAQKISEVRTMKAQALASTGALDDLQSAAVIYAELGDEASLAATQYQQAALLLENHKYTDAREIFAALGTYEDAATQLKACDYAIALQKKEAGQLDEAATLLESISGYSDADEQLKIVRYAQGEKAVADSLSLAAAQFFTQAGDYSDAADRAAAQYAAYYGPIADSARAQYNQQEYTAVADLLMNLDMENLPADYADLRDIFRESCYQAGESYYAAGQVYQAYPYYQEISDERRVKERLKEACYLVLGTWQDTAGNAYTFNLDGTCTLAGESLYFAVDGLTIRTGASADSLTATHQLTGISANSAWLFDQRNGANVRIRLTKVEK